MELARSDGSVDDEVKGFLAFLTAWDFSGNTTRPRASALVKPEIWVHSPKMLRQAGFGLHLGVVQAGDGKQLRRPADPDGRRQCRLTADVEVPGPRSRADQRHRVPPRMPRVAITFGCSRTTLRESTAEVLSRAVSARLPSGCQVGRPGLRSLSRTIDLRFGWARGIALRATRRCLGLSAHASGCAASQRCLRTENGMWHR